MTRDVKTEGTEGQLLTTFYRGHCSPPYIIITGPLLEIHYYTSIYNVSLNPRIITAYSIAATFDADTQIALDKCYLYLYYKFQD